MMRRVVKNLSKELVRGKVFEPFASTEILTRKLLRMPFDRWKKPSTWPRRISRKTERKLTRGFRMRRVGLPLQYIVKRWPFGEIMVECRKPVFIPRPETPQLIDIVERVLEKREWYHERDTTFVELGVGSGCISTLLFHRNPKFMGLGCDISSQAVSLAKKNIQTQAKLVRAATREQELCLPTCPGEYLLAQSDYRDFLPWVIEALQKKEGASWSKNTVFVSNPPYVSQQEYETYYSQLKYEDSRAIISPEEGLADVKNMLQIVSHVLQKTKSHHPVLFCFELSEFTIKALQTDPQVTSSDGRISITQICTDYYGRERFIVAELTSS